MAMSPHQQYRITMLCKIGGIGGVVLKIQHVHISDKFFTL